MGTIGVRPGRGARAAPSDTTVVMSVVIDRSTVASPANTTSSTGTPSHASVAATPVVQGRMRTSAENLVVTRLFASSLDLWDRVPILRRRSDELR